VPAATSPTARAISSIARPVSADVLATCSEAWATDAAERDIWVTALRSSATRLVSSRASTKAMAALSSSAIRPRIRLVRLARLSVLA
jgi:hypothetical protein